MPYDYNPFPDLDADTVLERTRLHWDLDSGFPLPGSWLACPVCQSPTIQGRFWQFFTRKPARTLPERCDIYLKCCNCAAIWTHGIALPTGYLAKHGHPSPSTYPWRAVRERLTGELPTSPPDYDDVQLYGPIPNPGYSAPGTTRKPKRKAPGTAAGNPSRRR